MNGHHTSRRTGRCYASCSTCKREKKTPKRKAYIVLRSFCDCTFILGVFPTREEAEKGFEFTNGVEEIVEVEVGRIYSHANAHVITY